MSFPSCKYYRSSKTPAFMFSPDISLSGRKRLDSMSLELKKVINDSLSLGRLAFVMRKTQHSVGDKQHRQFVMSTKVTAFQDLSSFALNI